MIQQEPIIVYLPEAARNQKIWGNNRKEEKNQAILKGPEKNVKSLQVFFK